MGNISQGWAGGRLRGWEEDRAVGSRKKMIGVSFPAGSIRFFLFLRSLKNYKKNGAELGEMGTGTGAVLDI